MSTLGNILWFVLGGAFMGLSWWFIGLLCFISIIGIPWGKACFVLGKLSFFPFGMEVVSRKDVTLKDDIGTGPLGLVGNIIWFVFFGFWLALGHLISAIICFITIIGIPFAFQHIKLVQAAIFPIGKSVVSSTEQSLRNSLNAKE